MSSCCGSYGNPFVQVLFMGASISQFSAAVSWDNSDGGMTIELAEDKRSGNPRIQVNGSSNGGTLSIVTTPDNFSPPSVGAPCFFWYGGFQTGGILMNWQQVDSANGPQTYSVKIGPPNSILAGTQVILSAYDGPTYGVNNLLNVHAVLESMGVACGQGEYLYTYPPFGMADALSYYPAPGWIKQSGEGWTWAQIRGVLAMLLATQGINYCGYHYIVDISELPILNSEIRIPGDSKSLLDIISDVCKIAGVEYFLEVIPMGGAGSCAGNLSSGTHAIKVRVGKSAEQAADESANYINSSLCDNIEDRLKYGSISRAVESASCVISKSRGLELCQNVFNAFITGDNRQDIWQIDYSGDCDGDDTIWPYWGKDVNGNVIKGTGCSSPADTWEPVDSHSFEIDITDLNIDGLSTWRVTLPELRAALVGESMWRTYLASLETEKFSQLFNTFNEAEFGNIIGGNDASYFLKEFAGVFNANDPDGPRANSIDFGPFSKLNADKVLGPDTGVEWIKTSKLFDYVRRYATEFYGKQFMVKLPFMCSSYDEDNPTVWGLNWEKSDGGWTDGPVLGLANNSWIVESFRLDDRRIGGFCRFVSDQMLLLDGVQKGSYFIVSPYEAYVGATVTDIVCVPDSNGNCVNDWRAVINLAGPVGVVNELGVPNEWVLAFAIISKYQAGAVDAMTWRDAAKELMHAGGDRMAMGGYPGFIMPVSAAVPLKSLKLVYGPWFAQDVDGVWSGNDKGTTEYYRDTGMSPWSYGSTAIMNYAGRMTAAAYVHDKFVVEMGEIRFAGSPVGSLGRLIYSLGPVVSRVDVQVGRGDGEVSTSYYMKTWTPSYKDFGIMRAKALQRTASIAVRTESMFKKKMLESIHNRMANSYYGIMMTEWKKVVGQTGASSHDVLFADARKSQKTDGDYARYNVVTSEGRKDVSSLQTTDASEWRRRAYMQQIGMFRPFSTIHKDAVSAQDDGRYFPRYDKSEKPPIGEDDHKLNDYDSSSSDKEDNILTRNSYFYTNEQVPPVYCYEPNIPITVNTLSPFLADENMLIPTSRGWQGDSDVKLASSSVGHDIEYIARDGVYPTHLSVKNSSYSEDHYYRAIALRGPLIIAGWGYDIDNHPVPNSSTSYDNWTSDEGWGEDDGPTRQFEDDWLSKPHKWKCGPVDLRWDYRRKVWTAPPAMKIIKAVLTDWLISEGGCAPAIMFDDAIQFDKEGKGIPTEEGCGKKGYKITIYNSYVYQIIPKGVVCTAYYDTTLQRYELLYAPGAELVEAILDEPLGCNADAEATIQGWAGAPADWDYPELGGCNPFEGRDKIKISNPLKQPICSGKRVFAKLTWAKVSNESSSGNPTLDDCSTTCEKVISFSGVVIQAEFHAECFVTSVDLICTKIRYTGTNSGVLSGIYMPYGIVNGTGNLYGTATGSICVPTDSLTTEDFRTCNIVGKAAGDILDVRLTGSNTNEIQVSGDITSTGVNSLPVDGSITLDLAGCGTSATGLTNVEVTIVPQSDVQIVSSGTIADDGKVKLDINCSTTIVTEAAEISVTLPSHSHPLSCGEHNVGICVPAVIDVADGAPASCSGIDGCSFWFTEGVTGPSGDGYADVSPNPHSHNLLMSQICSGIGNVTGTISTTGYLASGASISGKASIQLPSLNLDCGSVSGTIEGLTATGNVTVYGTFVDNIVASEIKIEATGNITGVCLPVSACLELPNVPVTGRIDDVILQTEADLASGAFRFEGETCTLTATLTIEDFFEYNEYDICVCMRQIFTESTAGETICSIGGTPCSCPQTCNTPLGNCGDKSPYVTYEAPCPVCAVKCTGVEVNKFYKIPKVEFTELTQTDCTSGTEKDPMEKPPYDIGACTENTPDTSDTTTNYNCS